MMSEKDEISKETLKRLQAPPNATRTPLFYGNAKIHTPNLPLRPIVSTVGSATYRKVKFLNDTLSQYVRNSLSYIQNAPDFLEMIKETTIEKDEIMVSFDVKSLFTSVPTRDATNIIEELIQNDETIEERTGMSPKTFMELVKLS